MPTTSQHPHACQHRRYLRRIRWRHGTAVLTTQRTHQIGTKRRLFFRCGLKQPLISPMFAPARFALNNPVIITPRPQTPPPTPHQRAYIYPQGQQRPTNTITSVASNCAGISPLMFPWKHSPPVLLLDVANVALSDHPTLCGTGNAAISGA